MRTPDVRHPTPGGGRLDGSVAFTPQCIAGVGSQMSGVLHDPPGAAKE